jgi:hypothetical protein
MWPTLDIKQYRDWQFQLYHRAMTVFPIDLGRARRTPRATQIYWAIREAIEAGRLASSARQPSCRNPAASRGLSSAGGAGASRNERRQLKGSERCQRRPNRSSASARICTCTPQSALNTPPTVSTRTLACLPPEDRELCRRWKEWGGAQVKKYVSDIDPEDADHPTIYGLRGTGILDRAEQGYEVDQIANDIGMSRQNVERYMCFRDQMKVGADGQKRLRPGATAKSRTRPRTMSQLYDRCSWLGLQNSWLRLQNFRKSAVISATSVGNGVTVAQQTLTLFV